MIEAEPPAVRFTGSARCEGENTAIKSSLPPQPKTVRETGLEPQLILELVIKLVRAVGKIDLAVLASKLCLSINVLRELLDQLIAEQLMEVGRRGESDLDIQYQLTTLGRQRAAEHQAHCGYVGPAPVTLEAYREVVRRQSRVEPDGARVGPAELGAAVADDYLDPGLRELIGAALQSGRPLLLHGPSGSGKSTLARKLGQLRQDLVAVPYAILIERHIIEFHDPALHLAPSARHQRHIENQRNVDARWVLCQRPLVQVGAELTRPMLDLRYDPHAKLYQAPPHFLANNGMLLVDDLGRQGVAPSDLLSRWAGPIDRGVDQLTLEGGHQVAVPFEATLVLATNLAPHLLLDDASLRRVGYKIRLGALSEMSYRALFRHRCRAAGIGFDETVLEHLVHQLHGRGGRPLLACYPAELLGRIADFAGFAGSAPSLTVGALEQAWASLFAGGEADLSAPAQPAAHFSAKRAELLFERL